MEFKKYYCINENCPDYEVSDKENITITQIYGKNKTKYLRCKTCGKRFSETHNTPIFGLRKNHDTVEKTIKCLAEGNSIRASARIMDLSKNTVCRWLNRLGEHFQNVSDCLIKDLHLTECQVDELWTFIKKKRKTSHR